MPVIKITSQSKIHPFTIVITPTKDFLSGNNYSGFKHQSLSVMLLGLPGLRHPSETKSFAGSD